MSFVSASPSSTPSTVSPGPWFAGLARTPRSVALECAAEPTPTVFIVGAGVVGGSLARRLVRAGVPVLGVHGRPSGPVAAGAVSGALASSGDLPGLVSGADVVIVAVRDARIPQIAARLCREIQLSPQQIVLHTAGSRAAKEVLGELQPRVAGIGTWHPLASLTGAPGTEDNLDGAAFALEGDEVAVAMGRRLARLVGGQALTVAADKMALYHAGAVFASNYVVALLDIARAMMVAAGIPDEEAQPALWPLLASVVRNLAATGLPAGLTGPVVRGDVGSIERHIEALAAHAPQQLELYQRLGREVLRLAQSRPETARPEDALRVAALLG
jgi:predicted short-subunit dehydrogenase-like oxidoreductase (DUF2520 family)